MIVFHYSSALQGKITTLKSQEVFKEPLGHLYSEDLLNHNKITAIPPLHHKNEFVM